MNTSKIITVVMFGLILLVSFASSGDLPSNPDPTIFLSSSFNRFKFIYPLKIRVCFERCKRKHCNKIRTLQEKTLQ